VIVQSGIGRPVGAPGAELVEGDDPVAVVDQAGMAVAQIVAGQARTAVEQQHHVVARPERVGDDLAALDRDPLRLVWFDLAPHAAVPPRLPSLPRTIGSGCGCAKAIRIDRSDLEHLEADRTKCEHAPSIGRGRQTLDG